MTEFRKLPLEKRREESARILAKYPDRIPVIVETNGRTKGPDQDKCKFLVPTD